MNQLINTANGDFVDFNADNATTNSFKITGQAGTNGTKNVETMVPLKYLSNSWRIFEMSLFNCKINLDLNWSENCVIVATNVANQSATFLVTDTKLYIPVVALSTQDNAKLLEQLKPGLKEQLTGININQKNQ